MKVVFIAPAGHYDGLDDVLQCAVKFAGCDVLYIGEQKTDACPTLPLEQFIDRANGIDEQLAGLIRAGILPNGRQHSIKRWFIAKTWWKQNSQLGPILFPDWDVMIFRNAEKAYEPFEHADWGAGWHATSWAGPYGIRDVQVLQDFADWFEKTINTKWPKPDLCDMVAWQTFGDEQNRTIADIGQIVNESAWDTSMHYTNGMFFCVNGTKELKWFRGFPSFHARDGRWVSANCIHCWGSFKTKTHELLEKAMTEYSGT